jgi:hypothetical protein
LNETKLQISQKDDARECLFFHKKYEHVQVDAYNIFIFEFQKEQSEKN